MATFNYNKETKKIEKKQDDHPAYVKTFLPTPNWRNLLGQHRRPSPQAHSNPSHGAGGGAGAYGTSPALAALPNPPTLKDYAKLFAISPIIEPAEPVPPTIPYAGIRTGEVIGERFWWIKHQGLTSLSTEFVWRPGATVSGDTNKEVSRWLDSFLMEYNVLYGGIYSFLHAHPYLEREEQALRQLLTKDGAETYGNSLCPIGFARGTIKMWGDVVEHERGFRAQFAKLVHIDDFWINPHDHLRNHDLCQKIVHAHNEVANAPSPLPCT